MAATLPAAWDLAMVESAEGTLPRESLTEPDTRGWMPPGWVPPTLAERVERTKQTQQVTAAPAEFAYDGTIDGLRGIPVTELASVSGDLAEKLGEFGIRSVYDLLMHIPLRYIDRSVTTPIAQMLVGQTYTLIGRVTSVGGINRPSNGRPMRISQLDVADATGKVSLSFFNSLWREKAFHVDDEVIVQGLLTDWTSARGVQYLRMTSPLMDRTGSSTARILPIYPQSAKSDITTWQIHRAAQEAVRRLGALQDPLPTADHRGLMGRADAYRLVHAPDEAGQESRARDRLAYDELVRMQLALLLHRQSQSTRPGWEHRPTGKLTAALQARLPYQLTGAQERALEVIDADLRAPRPMHRLLQGDVGSGKTLTALLTLLRAVESGTQTALMAPTEILATQHYEEIAGLCAGLSRPDGKPVRVEAITSRVKTKARRAVLAGLAEGDVDILVGTHALLGDDVQFARLGCVVVDEQHRFGVEQRASLAEKGNGRVPDMLVMTATPIPRTAAMTVFGDLDIVWLDELPPGRTPIHTEWVEELPDNSDPHDPVWRQVRDAVAAGRQCYVVCPLVEDSETRAAASATATLDALAEGALAGLHLGLVHGKLKGDEKTAVMEAFSEGGIDVLIATTVIEVGVNNPNASIIVILEPKSFGIAQLHQLRGRVGRGRHASVCILAGESSNEDTTRRIEGVVGTTDGARLSEIDLEIRGPGQILGSRQSGLSDLRVASLATDQAILGAAREDARSILGTDPGLRAHPVLRHEVVDALGADAEKFLTAS